MLNWEYGARLAVGVEGPLVVVVVVVLMLLLEEEDEEGEMVDIQPIGRGTTQAFAELEKRQG